jgi:hypothetical protein
MSEALLNAMSELDQLRDMVKQLGDSNEWLQEQLDVRNVLMQEYHSAILGLMKLTAAAYGHQVRQVPEYVAALKAIGEE